MDSEEIAIEDYNICGVPILDIDESLAVGDFAIPKSISLKEENGFHRNTTKD